VSPRIVIALLVIAIGGSLWALLPDNPGSLRDESAAARWTVGPGRALVGWVLVRNAGPDRITLRTASIGSGLPAGTRLLGVAARRGYFPAVGDRWPSPREAFRPLDGFVILPKTKATIAFGLGVPGKGRIRLADVRLGYRQDGNDHELPIGRPAVLRIAVNPRGR
jgi:hypothetical protein